MAKGGNVRGRPIAGITTTENFTDEAPEGLVYVEDLEEFPIEVLIDFDDEGDDE